MVINTSFFSAQYLNEIQNSSSQRRLASSSDTQKKTNHLSAAGGVPQQAYDAQCAQTIGWQNLSMIRINFNYNLMDVLNDIYLERENFEDRELLEKIKCLDCLLKCLLQTIEDQTHSNRLFFTGLVKKLSQNCLVNATPKLLDLQRSQFRSSALASLNEFRALKIWRKLLSFLI